MAETIASLAERVELLEQLVQDLMTSRTPEPLISPVMPGLMVHAWTVVETLLREDRRFYQRVLLAAGRLQSQGRSGPLTAMIEALASGDGSLDDGDSLAG